MSGPRTAERQRRDGTPERSLLQRRDALKRANRIRTFRALEKRRIKEREADGLQRLLDPPEEMRSMRVFDLLMSLPRVGRVKANRALVACRISPSKTLGGMTHRQRGELASLLRRR